MAASALLAAANVTIGLDAGSASAVAVGLEFLGDVMSSLLVFGGMVIASWPADENHPYGYGKFETLAGLIVGMILTGGGAGICWRSFDGLRHVHSPPGGHAVYPLLAAIAVRGVMSLIKFRVGRRIRSGALVADAWNDTVDILSSSAALAALGLSIYRPERFLHADQYGGILAGLAVIVAGVKVFRDAARDLADAMPGPEMVADVRRVALAVPGVLGVDKCHARKSGLQYFVDLHLEIDPNVPLWRSHEIGGITRSRLREELDWVADVLVHVEPAPGTAWNDSGGGTGQPSA